jgi:hypothetical protein
VRVKLHGEKSAVKRANTVFGWLVKDSCFK